MKKYKVILTEEQLRIISDALEFRARIGAGQLNEIKGLFHDKMDILRNEHAEAILSHLKGMLLPELRAGEYYGIYSDTIGVNSKISYDLYKQINYKLNPLHVEPHTVYASNRENQIEMEEIE